MEFIATEYFSYGFLSKVSKHSEGCSSFDTLCTGPCLLDQCEASPMSLTHAQGSSALIWRKYKLLLPEWALSAPHLTLRVISQPRAQNANGLGFLQTQSAQCSRSLALGFGEWRLGTQAWVTSAGLGCCVPLCQQHWWIGLTCSCLGGVSTSQVFPL